MPEGCVSIVYLWGDFQSVSQLAVALNLGFAALAGFLDNDIKREERKLRVEINRLRRSGEPATKPGQVSPSTTLRTLSGRARNIGRHYETVIDLWIRPVCLAGAFLGLTLLACSAFWYRDSIAMPYQVLMLLSLLPLVGALLYVSVIFTYLFFSVSCTRIRTVREHR